MYAAAHEALYIDSSYSVDQIEDIVSKAGYDVNIFRTVAAWFTVEHDESTQ